MLLFWIAAAVLSAAAAGLVLARARRVASAEVADPALAVHRRHLAELDDLTERGLLGEDEGKQARAEAGRRLLAAAEGARPAPKAVTPAERRLILVLAALAPALTLALYIALGRPDMPDQPFMARIKAWSAEPLETLAQDPARFGAVMDVLNRKNPNNPLIMRNLAEAQIGQNQPVLAEDTLRKAIIIEPRNTQLWLSLARARMSRAQDEFAPDALVALRQVLDIDPKDPEARYRLARARINGGDLAGGLADLRALQQDLPPGRDRVGLTQEIAEIEKAGGIPKPPPPGAAPPEGQQQMIAGMVDRLAARLAANPDDPDGWVMLVRAYTVQGATAKRDAALADARKRYAGNPQVLKKLTDALTAPVEGAPQ
ncbi:cytochrome c-type biogenesis protein CcmH [Caulobacter ginsengisoli]|uniref:Cytochrome c-type biogenesis protein CcmH n=1 Tax=Caulobacter ginsengisoli TaxID=400775 RepID=A0ABU0INE2_9CAUL|nr:c-type cytochrome biogenesis protein CcmI [Caulobacter ginsengisoli]MDQ0463522.1 cytochrome c-type biogenesis protein CcmH [Caulobacter ginsengisoli]